MKVCCRLLGAVWDFLSLLTFIFWDPPPILLSSWLKSWIKLNKILQGQNRQSETSSADTHCIICMKCFKLHRNCMSHALWCAHIVDQEREHWVMGYMILLCYNFLQSGSESCPIPMACSSPLSWHKGNSLILLPNLMLRTVHSTFFAWSVWTGSSVASFSL